jgi:integrase
MAIYKRNNTYWYDFRVAKVRHRGSTGEVNKRKAEAFHEDLKARKKREAKGLEVTITSNQTIHQTMDEYLEFCKQENRASTYESKRQMFCGGKTRRFKTRGKPIKELVPDAPLQTINADHIDLIRNGCQTQEKSTINRYCDNFKKFVAWATERKYFQLNPVQHVRSLTVPKKEPEVISDVDFQKIMGAVPMWLREIIWVDWLIGVRLSNITKLRYDQVNLKGKYIAFKPEDMKKGTSVRIDLEDLPELLEWFRVRRTAHPFEDYVWPSPRGGRVTGAKHYDPAYVGRRFTEQAAELGIKCTFHTIRHTFATRWAEWGMDLLSLGTLLSHKNINSTKIYSHVEDLHAQRLAKKKVVRTGHVLKLAVVQGGK